MKKGEIRRFKRYPAYKDSGVEWLREIPAHWHMSKMWDVTTATSGGTPPKEELGYWNGDIPWVSPKDMKHRFIESSEDHVSAAALHEVGLKLVSDRSVLIVVRGMILAHSFPVGITRVPVTINQDMKALRVRRDIDPEFFAYWLAGAAPNLLELIVDEAAHGTKVIRMDRWRVTPINLPPHSEQRQIGAFLDRETARIDELVARKERLIELLQEKRGALITRAVTEGLDPNVPMTISGFDILREMPSHWKLKPLTMSVVEKADYRGKTPEKVVSGVLLVTARNVRMGFIDYECSQEFVAEDQYDEIMRRGAPRKGDILFTTEAPLGNVALVDREDIALAQRIIRFRMDAKQFHNQFALFAMMSEYFQHQLRTLSTGSTAEGLKASKLSMLRLLEPPLPEQQQILEYVVSETETFNGLIEKVHEAIERLVELRTSLIAAAVTGKIDVREEVA